MLSKSDIFLYVCIAFLIGIICGSLHVAYYIVFIAWMLVVFIWFRSKKGLILGFAFLGIISCGMGYYEYSYPTSNPERIEYWQGRVRTFHGIVNIEPDQRKDKIKLTLQVFKIKDRNTWEKINGNILINADLYPRYFYGDILEVTCKIEKPASIDDFDYEKYLSNGNIYAICNSARIIRIKNKPQNIAVQISLKIKNKFVDAINSSLPEPHASLLNGILLGAKKGLPDALQKDFQISGISHIVAISGYNITIVSILLLNFAIRIGIGRKAGFCITLFGLLFFVVITGAQSSVMRAALMGFLALLAKNNGRTSDIKRILIFTAAFMAIKNPKVLLFDIGFELSFLATIGLVYMSSIIENKISWIPQIFSIRESLSTTLSAIFMTLPLIMFAFHRISLIAPVINITILPIIPPIMLIGTLLGIVSLFFPQGAYPVIGATWSLLEYIIFISHHGAMIPFASIEVPKFSCWFIGVVYGMALFIIFGRSFKKHKHGECK